MNPSSFPPYAIAPATLNAFAGALILGFAFSVIVVQCRVPIVGRIIDE
jgi:cytochrome c biogenesis protein CcdA